MFKTWLYDPDADKWHPAVPLPYWRRPWRRLFKATPCCFACNKRPFSDVKAYEGHWLREHVVVGEG